MPAAIRALKAQDGPELQVHGSANLLQTLIAHGLVDSLHLWIFPLVLGAGKRLFAEARFRTASSYAFAGLLDGVILATYRPGGDQERFVVRDPSEAELDAPREPPSSGTSAVRLAR